MSTLYITVSVPSYGLNGNINGNLFSTFDNDRDRWSGGNCPCTMLGGWWYYNCYFGNPNGPYREPGSTGDKRSMNYMAFSGHTYESLQSTKLMFK